MVEVATWQDEILRQNSRLAADLPARQIGMALTYIIFGFYLPFWLIFLLYLINIGCETFHHRLATDFKQLPSRRLQLGIIATSVFGMTAFCLPPVLVWHSDNLIFKFVACAALVGGLLHVVVARSTHLKLGLFTLIPPALVVIWLPISQIRNSDEIWLIYLATVAAAVLIGYFLTALVQNYRTQTELVQAWKAADAASQAKSRFLSSMSHEIRTPLNAILGFSQIVRDSPETITVADYCNAVEGAARRLGMLVDDVLDLASFSEGEIHFNPITAAFRQELSAAVSAFDSEASVDGVRITSNISDEVPELGRFDPFLLRKCLSHICIFMLQSHPEPDAKILTIQCSLVPGMSNWLRVEIGFGQQDGELVAYAGNAIPVDDSEALSLTLVHRITEAMGAQALVAKTTQGAHYAKLDFPFITMAEPPAKGVEAVYGHLRALVVDDIATNRFIVSQLLRSLRIDLAEADSGAEALEWLKAEPFDLILLDMNMPGIDGEATFRAIRNSGEDWASIPVIAVTADALVDQRAACLKLGLNGYLAKPVDKRLLWSEILHVVPPPPPL